MPMFIMLGSFVVFRQIYLYLTYRWFGTLLPVALGYPVGWVMCSTSAARVMLSSRTTVKKYRKTRISIPVPPHLAVIFFFLYHTKSMPKKQQREPLLNVRKLPLKQKNQHPPCSSAEDTALRSRKNCRYPRPGKGCAPQSFWARTPALC